MNKTIAIQGIEASFHEVAAQKYFGSKISTIKCLSFQDLCDALKNKNADYAIMAIENSIAGSLLQNYGLLQEYNFKVIGEVYLRIKMNIMALPSTKLEDLKFVQSHPIAIRQCSHFLKSLPNVQVEEKEDTAICAKNISQNKLTGVAAIASEAAAEHFGLEILAKGIETNKQNFTRFLVLSNTKGTDIENNKASIFFQLPHDPGALANILNLFAKGKMNLTKIQSVPIIGKPYEYNFHLDFEWKDYENYLYVIKNVREISENLEILGEYKKGIIDITKKA